MFLVFHLDDERLKPSHHIMLRGGLGQCVLTISRKRDPEMEW